ncbi:MAG TPA: hypothetical protein VHS96_04910, partial [Bacteroidia bacterium]|nr:hypothetical protein [Bacteroidia bacterium]
AHYFYGAVKPTGVPPDLLGSWLANGPVDKPVYLVTRIDKATEEFEGWFGNFKRLGGKNGFVFYKREIPLQQ